jgi:hypothetical protein
LDLGEDGGNYVMMSFIIFTLHQTLYFGDKSRRMGRCDICGGDEKCIEHFSCKSLIEKTTLKK